PPARGSLVFKHGQSDLDQLIRSNLHFLSISQTVDEQDVEFESHTQSEVRFPFKQQAGHFPPALGSAELKHGQLSFDIQYAGHIPSALGSEDDLHEHLSFGIPTSQDESLGHLQPEGQFDSEHAHESFGVQLVEFESQTQSEVGISGPLQYAGHTLLPALGSSVLKHGQSEATEKLVIFVSHVQFDVVYPFTQQAGHSPPALGSALEKLQSHKQSGVKDPLIQYAGQIPSALGSAVDLHQHLDLGMPTNNVGSVGHLHPDGELVPVHSHEFVGTVVSDDVVHFFSD
ncbi:MAG: hypothetical protein EZS28_045684, partial [Streblomastix strix]